MRAPSPRRHPRDIDYTREIDRSRRRRRDAAPSSHERGEGGVCPPLIMNERHSRRSDGAIKIISYLAAVIVTSP